MRMQERQLAGVSGFLMLPFLVLISVPLWAQDVPKLGLRVADEIPVRGETFPGMTGPIRCDTKGNIYLRPSKFANPLQDPILKISPEGKAVAYVALQSVPGYSEAQLWDFAISGREQIYTLAAKPVGDTGELHVLSFDERGRFNFDTKLESLFNVDQMAAFTDGSFLLAGSRPIPESQQHKAKSGGQELGLEEPVTAVFDRGGRLVAELKFDADSSILDTTDPEVAGGLPVEVLSLGSAAGSEDGNVYLLRVASPPIVYIVASTGSLVKTLKIDPPIEKAHAVAMQATEPGRFLLQFAPQVGERRYDLKTSIFSIIDADTGKRVVDYQTEPAVGGVFACYSRGAFYLLASTSSGGLAIRRVVAK